MKIIMESVSEKFKERKPDDISLQQPSKDIVDYEELLKKKKEEAENMAHKEFYRKFFPENLMLVRDVVNNIIMDLYELHKSKADEVIKLKEAGETAFDWPSEDNIVDMRETEDDKKKTLDDIFSSLHSLNSASPLSFTEFIETIIAEVKDLKDRVAYLEGRAAGLSNVVMRVSQRDIKYR